VEKLTNENTGKGTRDEQLYLSSAVLPGLGNAERIEAVEWIA
jgi:hypothetical protein